MVYRQISGVAELYFTHCSAGICLSRIPTQVSFIRKLCKENTRYPNGFQWKQRVCSRISSTQTQPNVILQKTLESINGLFKILASKSSVTASLLATTKYPLNQKSSSNSKVWDSNRSIQLNALKPISTTKLPLHTICFLKNTLKMEAKALLIWVRKNLTLNLQPLTNEALRVHLVFLLLYYCIIQSVFL